MRGPLCELVDAADGRSLRQRVEDLFRARPGEWIDGREIARVGGFYGWRTRLSELRRRGMNIVNRERRIETPDGRTVTRSEYRFDGSSDWSGGQRG